MEISQIAKFFLPNAKIEKLEPYGNGHINDTYIIEADGNRYILQRVNNNVFNKPEQVMHNIIAVNEFIKKSNKPTQLVLMELVKTKDGEYYIFDETGGLFRMYRFVEGGLSLDLPESEEDFYNSAVAFGEFQYLLQDFPADTLYETIPDFHNTEKRYANFLKSLKEDKMHRAAGCKEEIDFVNARKEYYSLFEDLHKKGELPLKVTHNDTKLNNCLLDVKTRKPLCVIDLDTIMPGYSINDFGDSIRFGASTAKEDEKDLNKVHFDIHLFELYTKGFMEGTRGTLNKTEKEMLPYAAKMMTIECGMRFLTDYLDGDVYFKTAYPEHNLVRARTQFKLVQEMEENLEAMKKIIEKY